MSTIGSTSCQSRSAKTWAKKSKFSRGLRHLSRWSQARAICSMRVNMLKCDDYFPNPKYSADYPVAHVVVRRVAQAVIAGLLALLVVGCNVGPNYKRLAVSTPQSFRGALAPEI